MEKEKQEKPQNNNDEIDLIEVIRHIWDGRWLIVKVTVAFIVLGIVIAFTTTPKYTAQALLLPEQQQPGRSSNSLLRQFGVRAGLSGNNNTDALGPFLYPEIIKTTEFLIELMHKPLEVEIDGKIINTNVINYFNEYESDVLLLDWIKKYTIRLPWTVTSWFRKKNESEQVEIKNKYQGKTPHIRKLTSRQNSALNSLTISINSNINDRNWIMTINAETKDPYVSAQLTQLTVDLLSNYITNYRTQKAQKYLQFVKERYEEKQEEFHSAQMDLAKFRDANKNIISASAKVKEEHLQNQYNLTFDVYNNLAHQLEHARIKVQEETPVIKVLEPVQVPLKRSAPNRMLIIFIYSFSGAIIGLLFIFTRIIWFNMKDKILV